MGWIMSHYTDVGFYNFQDDAACERTLNDILADRYGAPEIRGVGGGRSLCIYSLNEIRFAFLVNDATKEAIEFEIGHRGAPSTGVNAKWVSGTFGKVFRTITVEVGGRTFYFNCLNSPAVQLQEEWGAYDGNRVSFSAAGFAEYIEVLEPSELYKSRYKKMAAESYSPYRRGDFCRGFVSGVVKRCAMEHNPVTQEGYLAAEVDCRGVHFKLLVDRKMPEAALLRAGKLLRGWFWNTAVLTK